MSETIINDFSLLCRLFGNLFYRCPDDPILAGTFLWLQQGQLKQHWALTTDAQSEQALAKIEQGAHPTALGKDYQALFGEQGAIATTISAYGLPVADFATFREQRGMPPLAQPDHVALLLLTASWVEDNLQSLEAQKALFEQFLLPCLSKFLGKVEAFDSGFYKALAQLCRDALAAMADELEEADSENPA
ncbi:hypothetical protein RO21_01750 [[Actinobacillus] muris]|uniref:Molecular chaperone n=1 Tax=Muribacter muris TaxID=67855 RepID=A0A0J5P9E5_9PAST|nr:molecular chaperone [Muribacter muris]KMK52335.1 hypothetical protein RO21_01750 [[Actinobacillus] muris] [Muribacter muris]